MRLLDSHLFECLFEPLSGKRIGFVELEAYPGHRLCSLGAHQLFERFGVICERQSIADVAMGRIDRELDELVLSCNGGAGRITARTQKLKQLALNSGFPVTMFPQSLREVDEDTPRFKQVYVRERKSLALDARFILAPDTALGVEVSEVEQTPQFALGIFLSNESADPQNGSAMSLGDPSSLCETADEMMSLAAPFERIVTDEFEFAVAGLLARRKVSLLCGNDIFNHALFDAWLKQLGCERGESLRDFDYDVAGTARSCYQQLAGPATKILPWSCNPVRETGFEITLSQEEIWLAHINGTAVARLDDTAAVLWSWCDGNSTIDEIVTALVEKYPSQPLNVARDVQQSLAYLRSLGALTVRTEDMPACHPPVLGKPRPASESEHFEIHVRDPLPGQQHIEAEIRAKHVRHVLRFEVNDDAPEPTHKADPFVLGVLFAAMSRNLPIKVFGAPISASLNKNLREFQSAWNAWKSNLNSVDIIAETTFDGVPADEGVMYFSGGLDSWYTLDQHTAYSDTLLPGKLLSVVSDLGIDARVDRTTRQGWEEIMETRGISSLTVTSNLVDLYHGWLDWQGPARAACLSLFQDGFGYGILPSASPNNLWPVASSNPITDWLLGSDQFLIRHDGAHLSWVEKFSTLTDWPEMLHLIRACDFPDPNGANCGLCLTCVLIRLIHQVEGVESMSYPGLGGESEIVDTLSTTAPNPFQLLVMRRLLARARILGINPKGLQIISNRFGRTTQSPKQRQLYN